MDILHDTKHSVTKLVEQGTSIAEIARNYGVGSKWLSNVVKGQREDPGVIRVQRVYNGLCRDGYIKNATPQADEAEIESPDATKAEAKP